MTIRIEFYEDMGDAKPDYVIEVPRDDVPGEVIFQGKIYKHVGGIGNPNSVAAFEEVEDAPLILDHQPFTYVEK